jgi:hypothetical protein
MPTAPTPGAVAMAAMVSPNGGSAMRQSKVEGKAENQAQTFLI